MMIAALLVSGCACGTKLPDEPQALIEMLAKTSDEFAPRQAVAASHKLMEMGTAAFPALIDNSNDEREAWGCFDMDVSEPTTVGVVCTCIVQSQVEMNLPKAYRDMWMLGLASKDKLAEWWKERSGRSLRELQIEAARYSLHKAESWPDFIAPAEKREVMDIFRCRLAELGAKE
jgi:hypothetical protein